MPSFRSVVADIAHSQVGATDARPYFEDALGYQPTPAPGKRIHWCGIFALWCLRRSGLTSWQWRLGDGFIYRLGWDQATHTPHIGDVAYFTRAQHHAIVVAVNLEDDTVTTIDGNTGAAPGRVGQPKVRRRRQRGLTYYSIGKLIAKAESAGVSDTDPAPPPTPIPPSDPLPVRDLRRGDKGKDVGRWQRELLRRGYDLGHWRDDDDFGELTETATVKFQKYAGIAGVVDARTREAAESD